MPKTTRPRGKLYFAYGSNLAWEQFRRRCPLAKPVSRCTLPGYRLVFNGPADIMMTQRKGAKVEGALYRITPACERELDAYEGFPTLYVKRYFPVAIGKGKNRRVEDVMFYTMATKRTAARRRPPHAGYVDIIRTGYDDWRIPHKALDRALSLIAA